MQSLHEIAKALVTEGRGILAADESIGTCDKRFDAYAIPKTPEMRRKWRELLLTTPGIEKGLSGVILFDETFRQRTETGERFPEYLGGRGIIPGIKVDEGLMPLPGSEGESVTKGLDGLSERLFEYKVLGARFAKWRAVIKIFSPHYPTERCIRQNADILAEYALQCQKAGIVPILEPEVLLDGDHTLARSGFVLSRTLHAVFHAAEHEGVDLKAMLLKTSMVLPGKSSGETATDAEITQATLDVFSRTIPPKVPGVVFLSGGQTPTQATTRLNEISKKALKTNAPWPITFSYSRALQEPVLAKWLGREENVEAAQLIFQDRVRQTALASLGKLN